MVSDISAKQKICLRKYEAAKNFDLF